MAPDNYCVQLPGDVLRVKMCVPIKPNLLNSLNNVHAWTNIAFTHNYAAFYN